MGRYCSVCDVFWVPHAVHLYSVGLCIIALLAMHSCRGMVSVSVVGTCRGMALVKFAAPCITAQFALLHVMCVKWRTRTELPSCLSGSGPSVMRSVSMVPTSACLFV